MMKTKKKERETSMKTPIALFVVGIVASLAACSTGPGERHSTIEQRLDTEGGDTDAGGGPAACAHAICATGAGLTAACDPCATQLCAQDPYCCSTSWDATCVGEVGSICGQSCTVAPPAPDAGASTCAHPICATGVPLETACEPCAATLCAQDPYCCAMSWDATCVGEVGSICGQACN